MLSAHSTAACRHTLCAHWAPFLQLRPGPSCAAGAVALTGARTPLLQGASETKKSRRQEKKSPACLRGHGHGLSCARRTAALQAGGRQHRCANERALRGKATPRPHIAFVPGSAAAPTGRTARGDRARGRLLTCGSGGHGPGTGGRRGDRAERPGPEDPAAARPPTAATAPRPPQPPSAPRLPLPPAAMATRRRSLPLPGRQGSRERCAGAGLRRAGEAAGPRTQRAARSPATTSPSCGDSQPRSDAPPGAHRAFCPCPGAARERPSRPRGLGWGRRGGEMESGGPAPPPRPARRRHSSRERSRFGAAAPPQPRFPEALRVFIPGWHGRHGQRLLRGEVNHLKSHLRTEPGLLSGRRGQRLKENAALSPSPAGGDLEFVPSAVGHCPSPAWGGAPSPGRGHRAPPGAGLPLGALRREGFGPGSSQTSKPRAFVLPCSSAGKCTRGQQQPGMLCLK